ncbi:MAG: polysaccharide biosynthesis/export family protein [Phycisphaerales bacterium]|nr:polysaccharide biosynthesis/export family protein [Phycisphaerales bacterium]
MTNRYDDARTKGTSGRGIIALTLLVCAIFYAIVGTGCGPSDAEINAFVHDYEADVTGGEYIVQPPDVMEITSPNCPEVDGESVTVNADGKITLKLVGDVKVAGMTPVEIARKLEANLQRYYQRPVVSVRMTRRDSKRIYVFGEVAGQGPLPYTGRDTVLSVLGEVRPTFAAWADRVHVIRPSHEDGKRHVIIVNANDIMKRGRLDKNFHLLEGDILYVPPTPLAYVGQKFQELLQPMQPAAQAYIAPGYALNSGDTYYNKNP